MRSKAVAMLKTAAIAALFSLGTALVSEAATLEDVRTLYASGQYFKAARYAFSAQEERPSVEPEAMAWIAVSLTRAGLYQSASYFFVRALETGNPQVIRMVTPVTAELLKRVGVDLLRPYLIRHTQTSDYNAENRAAYAYALGKSHLLSGREKEALDVLVVIPDSSPFAAAAAQLRGTARAITGNTAEAIREFGRCEAMAPTGSAGEDLRARCQAGIARTLYQLDRFEDADRAYDRVDKRTFVWTDILFEQAWNSFSRREYNRTLGKLVTYRSPSLNFVFNPEVDVLKAHAYVMLCQYGYANEAVNQFNSRYEKIGEQIKTFVERNSDRMGVFFEEGKTALNAPLHSPKEIHRVLNRFIRSPYFADLVKTEALIPQELAMIRRFDAMQPGVEKISGQGFPGFLTKVLNWRRSSIQWLGGAFVKNSLMDYHAALIADFEKVAFIKLEMLSRAKDRLLSTKSPGADRSIGSVEPSRRDDQFRWSFNGEFWLDELGDYVFALESTCG